MENIHLFTGQLTTVSLKEDVEVSKIFAFTEDGTKCILKKHPTLGLWVFFKESDPSQFLASTGITIGDLIHKCYENSPSLTITYKGVEVPRL